MKPSSLKDLMQGEPTWRSPEGDAEFWVYGMVDAGRAWVGRFVGCNDWTMHPDGDAFFQQVEGEIELTVREGDVDEKHKMGPGDVMLVPRGMWYRNECEEWVMQMGIAPEKTLHESELE